jgi:hypothetical protein
MRELARMRSWLSLVTLPGRQKQNIYGSLGTPVLIAEHILPLRYASTVVISLPDSHYMVTGISYNVTSRDCKRYLPLLGVPSHSSILYISIHTSYNHILRHE